MMAQVRGGRKKEHRNQRGGGGKLFGGKSRGNANSFAKGGHKKNFLARIFKGNKSNGPWVYHKTNPGKKQKKEQAILVLAILTCSFISYSQTTQEEYNYLTKDYPTHRNDKGFEIKKGYET